MGENQDLPVWQRTGLSLLAGCLASWATFFLPTYLVLSRVDSSKIKLIGSPEQRLFNDTISWTLLAGFVAFVLASILAFRAKMSRESIAVRTLAIAGYCCLALGVYMLCVILMIASEPGFKPDTGVPPTEIAR